MSKEKDYEAFKELCEITALLNRNAPRNAVTVQKDKLIELQKKAALVDELKEINVALLTQIEAQARVISKLEKHNEELAEWLNMVSLQYKRP